MNIKLVRLTPQYREQLFEMLTEWKADIENNRTNPSPYAIFRNDFHDFDYYLQNLEIKEGNTFRTQRCFALTKTEISLSALSIFDII